MSCVFFSLFISSFRKFAKMTVFFISHALAVFGFCLYNVQFRAKNRLISCEWREGANDMVYHITLFLFIDWVLCVYRCFYCFLFSREVPMSVYACILFIKFIERLAGPTCMTCSRYTLYTIYIRLYISTE